MGIGDFLFDLFASLGDQGALICIFLLFFLDALLIPTLPELFFILALGVNGSIGFAFAVLAAGFIGEMAGVALLYTLASKAHIPSKIEHVMKKYVNFLLVSDEKVMLINRIAPMVPFVGAFMAIMKDKWDAKKCVFWLLIGYIAKYGAILLLSAYLATYFGSSTAKSVMLVTIIALIAISALLSMYRKRKAGIGKEASNENCDSD